MRIVLYPDTTELKDLPANNQYCYYNGDLAVSDDGTYVEASGAVYNVWKVLEPTRVSCFKEYNIVYVDADSIYQRKVGWFTKTTEDWYKAGTLVVEEISSPHNVTTRCFGLKTTILGRGISELSL